MRRLPGRGTVSKLAPVADLPTIEAYLYELLGIDETPDEPGAHNGLQLSNDGGVGSIGAAVDANLPVIEQAVERGVDFLLVHHGLFWAGVEPIAGALYRKLKLAMDNNLAIFSVHIPLDVHETYGNNVRFAAALGMEETTPFFPWKGILLGRRATVPRWSRTNLLAKIEEVSGAAAHCAPGGPEEVEEIGIITGGAGSEVAAVAREGIDTFITGEGPHYSYALAEELGVNLIYAGHYATETFGVIALARHLAQRYELPHRFLDHPSGL